MLTCVAAAPVVNTVFSVDIGTPAVSFDTGVDVSRSAMVC